MELFHSVRKIKIGNQPSWLLNSTRLSHPNFKCAFGQIKSPQPNFSLPGELTQGNSGSSLEYAVVVSLGYLKGLHLAACACK